ncbi:MAG: hypothetical protein JJE25_02545 [Bacteroidia bacterium]|nr:hypothetical protein [Bacteroidia bacterium]
MGTLKKIEDYILPQEIDFFKLLQEQSMLTKNIIDELHNIYITQSSVSPAMLKKLIQQAQDMRKKNLGELYKVFITPVDKEAISRAYINLDWVVMSIEHLQVELEIYEMKNLTDYKTIFDLLKDEINDIHSGFGMLPENNIEKFSHLVFNVVHYDNELIKEYATQVSIMFGSNDIKKIITRKEILNQLKEISKRIRICANDLEDMLYKMR